MVEINFNFSSDHNHLKAGRHQGVQIPTVEGHVTRTRSISTVITVDAPRTPSGFGLVQSLTITQLIAILAYGVFSK